MEKNVTDVCSTMVENNDKRPDISETIYVIGSCLLYVFLSLIFLSNFAVARFKHYNYFGKIRPLGYIVFVNVMIMLSLVGYLVPTFIRTFPCWLELSIHTITAAVASSVFFVRSFLFLVESNIAYKSHRSDNKRKEGNDRLEVSARVEEEEEEEEEERGNAINRTTSSVGKYDNKLTLFLFFLGLSCRRQKIFEKKTLSELSQLKNNTNFFLSLSFVPPIVVLVICSFSIPDLYCVECPFTYVQLVIVTGAGALTLLINVNLTMETAAAEYADDQQVMTELLFCLFFSVPFIYVGYALELTDPGAYQYERVFYWRYLLCLGPINFWVSTTVFPLILCNTQRKNNKFFFKNHGEGASDWYETLRTKKDLKAEFSEYCRDTYCVENINFLDDVYAYNELSSKASYLKGNTMEQMSTLRENIIKTYVERDSVSEINIGSEIREEILFTNKQSDGLKLYIFSKAEEEVKRVTYMDKYRVFETKKKKCC